VPSHSQAGQHEPRLRPARLQHLLIVAREITSAPATII